jgi:hypothetical protein
VGSVLLFYYKLYFVIKTKKSVRTYTHTYLLYLPDDDGGGDDLGWNGCCILLSLH